MVRWRADQANPWCGIADPGDVFINLSTRQFPAFTGLGTLGNLDLDFVCVRKIPGGNSKTTRSHLFDRRALEIAVGKWLEPLRILTTLPCITLTAQAIHCNRERFMGLGRDGSKTHGTSTKPPHNVGCRFNLGQRHRRTGYTGPKRHQSAQCAAATGFSVNRIGKIPIGRFIVFPSGPLQTGYGLGLPSVFTATGAPVIFARVGQARNIARGSPWKSQLVTSQDFLCQHIKTHALQTACGVSKAQIDDFALHTDGLEYLCAFIGLQSRDPHFSHHLKNAFGDTFAIGAKYCGIVRQCLGIQFAVAARLPQ